MWLQEEIERFNSLTNIEKTRISLLSNSEYFCLTFGITSLSKKDKKLWIANNLNNLHNLNELIREYCNHL